jgi:hypothetical protein
LLKIQLNPIVLLDLAICGCKVFWTGRNEKGEGEEFNKKEEFNEAEEEEEGLLRLT